MTGLSNIFNVLGIDGEAEELPASEPQHPQVMEYRCWCAARLGGRARSGSDSSGKVIHAVWTNTPTGGIDFSTAACGAHPGRTSYGFTIQAYDNTSAVTCRACREKLGLK